ncbi:hypothetical protein [Streptomyces sp. Inha503]|uniref:hypothetical protein n=1 Tax=Streptomyces sp. Inha503 TaxID=3383314 RepID=UPI0039A2E595
MVGESGSDKSLTSRAIIRLLPEGARTHGTITFDGQNIQHLYGESATYYLSHETAMIFQNPRAHINPVRTVVTSSPSPLPATSVSTVGRPKNSSYRCSPRPASPTDRAVCATTRTNSPAACYSA